MVRYKKEDYLADITMFSCFFIIFTFFFFICRFLFFTMIPSYIALFLMGIIVIWVALLNFSYVFLNKN